ncbi:hypothetical protein SASPL_145487 [Salvia splendens]|uniref:Integrase catalytic domain-containing protein n=1 Tax=Salvia splendens TaxID=180675 RepID=A0A8X8WHQ1_SALSN|nr:hypothetical protein SASPL_145487 [Salvia splendens]
MVEEIVGELCSKEEEAEEGVPNPTTKPLLNAINVINLDTINMSVQCGKSKPIMLSSGCSNHMCGYRSMFCELDEDFKQMVNLGNNMKMSVAGKGYVRLWKTTSRLNFQKKHMENIQELELVHADLCVPIYQISNSYKRYRICFIDDFSRKAWVNFLVEKSDAFAAFKIFKNYVEKETGLAIKYFRTDRGGEFTSREFNEYCKMNGIKRQLTNAYTPSPTLSVKDVTREEAWSGIKPFVEHFIIFGSIAHAHVPDVRRTKLEDKSYSCVLFGVRDESKGYKLYDLVSRKVVISRDVVFVEEQNWDWDKSYEDNILPDLECGTEKEKNISFGSGREDTETDDEVLPSPMSAEASPESCAETSPESSSLEAGRNRRVPAWMIDYKTGDNLGLSDEDINIHMAFVVSTNPIIYDEPVKADKWREAMNSEIESIRRMELGCLEDRKTTSGYAFILSSGAVAWSLRKQPIVTLSTTEAEFVAAAACSCQVVWMKRILKELGYEGSEGTTIFCDNSSTIKLSKNPMMHGRSKHIDVVFHFLRELVEKESCN